EVRRPLITGGTPSIDRNSGNTLIGDTSASSSQERVCLTQKLWVAYVAALGVANEHSEVVADNDDMFSVFKMFCKSQDLNLAEMSTVGTEQGEKEYGFSDDMVELLLFALEDLKRSLKERGFNLMISCNRTLRMALLRMTAFIQLGISDKTDKELDKIPFVVESTLHPAYHAVKRLLADFKPSDAASGPISHGCKKIT
ncbi:hypothetical protein FXO38_13912, partial [Capsicum annuum]